MKAKIEKVAVICGACDSAAFLIIVYLFLLMMTGNANLILIIGEHLQPILFFVLPLTILIFWRGHHDGERLYLGTNWFERAIIEGFQYGATIPLMFILAEYLASLLSRENIFDEISSLLRNAPIWFFVIFLISVLMTGAIGSILASLFQLINRIIVKD